jgi:hypothetical protein
MNHYYIILSIFTFCFFVSCSDKPKQISNTDLTEQRTDTTSTSIATQAEPPVDVDEKFDTFLRHFNKDSLFQISRIVFPLNFKEVDMDSEDLGMIIGKIEKSDFLKMDFTYDKSIAERTTDAYTQRIEVMGNKATIVIKGVDNGIATDYFFEKRKGKWMLVYFEDHST